MKYLTKKEFIELLAEYPDDIPVIVTREGNGHNFGVTAEEINVQDSAYFGNDQGAQEAWPQSDENDKPIERKFLNIGTTY